MTNEAHLGRQGLQRQTALIALTAQGGGDHGGSEAQWPENRSYDRVNSYGCTLFFAMLSVR